MQATDRPRSPARRAQGQRARRGVLSFLPRWIDLGVGLLVLGAAMALRLADPPALERIRLFAFDRYQAMQPRVYTPLPVRVVDIDEESLLRHGQWPWPRTLLARLVDRLSQAGAVAIAFDVVFAEPDRTSPRAATSLWPKAGDTEHLEDWLRSLPDHDAVLAESLGQSNAVIGFFLSGGQDRTRLPAGKARFAFAGDDPLLFLPRYTDAVPSLKGLESAAAGVGSINMVPDRDGIVRRIPTLLRLEQDVYPSLVAETLRIAQRATTYGVKASGASGEISFGAQTGITNVRIGQVVVPTDRDGQIRVHFTRTVPERLVPAWRVLAPDFDPALVDRQIIFIGSTAPGLRDQRATPLNPADAGVLVHAQATEQILLGSYLVRPDWADGAELLFLVGLGGLLVLLLPRIGALWCWLIGGSGVAAAVAFSWWAYDSHRILLDPIYPAVAALLVYLAESLMHFLRTESDRRQVRGAFGQYVSPALLERLETHPEQLRLGGEIKELTFLFSDLRDFTAIAESFKEDPQGLTTLMNRVLTTLTEAILERQGTIDKYMGDAVMAFWGAPLDVDDHAAQACAAALEMRERLAALNAERRREADAAGEPFLPLKIGIGVNSGACVVGNMGSDQHFDYTVLGDAVNLASRLEGQTKAYGVAIIVGEDTVARLADRVAALELDLIAVKGKREPVRIFALLGDAGLAGDPGFLSLAEHTRAMQDSYRAQHWDAAAAALASCRRLTPDLGLDRLFDLYEDRIATYRQSPPGPDWDGVYVAATK